MINEMDDLRNLYYNQRLDEHNMIDMKISAIFLRCLRFTFDGCLQCSRVDERLGRDAGVEDGDCISSDLVRACLYIWHTSLVLCGIGIENDRRRLGVVALFLLLEVASQ